MEDEPGSDLGLMFSRVVRFHFRMGRAHLWEEGSHTPAHLYIQ